MTGLEVFGVRGGPRLDARSQRCGSWFHYATVKALGTFVCGLSL
jgi:hypothetical protein